MESYTWQDFELPRCHIDNGGVANSKQKKRISRDQWLSKGLELFAVTGAQGLRVEVLARAVGVAKSGFYCHFKDRDEFLDRLLDYWAHEYTEVVTENTLMMHLPARERLQILMTMVFEQNLTEYDAAMDMWSRTDSRVARKRRRVINMRLAFIRRAFEELGFTGDELEMRTRVCAGFQMSERQIFGRGKAPSQRYRELRLKMLIGETD